MGIGIKGAGITVSGIAAYIIINRLIRASKDVISNLAEASKWRNYYRFGNDRTVPPGYARVRVDDPKNGSYEDRSPEEQRKEENKNKEGFFDDETKNKISDFIVNSIDNFIHRNDPPKENNVVPMFKAEDTDCDEIDISEEVNESMESDAESTECTKGTDENDGEDEVE